MKKHFAKRYTPNWPGEVFIITKIKETSPWTYVISDLNGGLENFMKKNCLKLMKKNSEQKR